MNNHHHHHDLYYDQPASRSPGSHRHQPQTLHRQPSRQFDAYGQMPNNMYTPDDHSMRYDANRFERMNTTVQNGYNYEIGAQTWTSNPFAVNNHFAGPFAATGRMKSVSRGRTGLPATWLDQQQQQQQQLIPTGNPFGGIGPSPLGGQPVRPDSFSNDPDEELIPTAIVIKNIPFAVKKEQLVELMTQMSLPLPYAFNYHFDNGVFRGLAFANFTSADETATVIENLNHFELQGRKLRVEYKKMLPLQERERIEREKRERRGQLEEQHRPMVNNQVHSQPSMSSVSSHIPATSPSPNDSRADKPGVDLNDPQTLSFYSELLLFRDDLSREALIFPSALSPNQRRLVHTLAHHMGLSHISRGNGDQRQVHVVRAPVGSNISPPIPQVSAIHAGDASRRGLNRAATIDFNEARSAEPGMYNTLRGQQSSGFLGIPDSPGSFGTQPNLRAAKSYADLRSYTPSPVPSSASFPAALQSNIARYGPSLPGSAASTTPTLTPTASGSALGQTREEGLLVSGLGNMTLGNSLGPAGPNGGSPRRPRPIFSWDQDNQQQATTGPIGSNRQFSLNYEDSARNGGQTLPLRQPRGPAAERGSGFSRARQSGHQARGSDEMRPSSGVEIIVE